MLRPQQDTGPSTQEEPSPFPPPPRGTPLVATSIARPACERAGQTLYMAGAGGVGGLSAWGLSTVDWGSAVLHPEPDRREQVGAFGLDQVARQADVSLAVAEHDGLAFRLEAHELPGRDAGGG